MNRLSSEINFFPVCPISDHNSDMKLVPQNGHIFMLRCRMRDGLLLLSGSTFVKINANNICTVA